MNTKNWKEININKIFDIDNGNKLDMCQMTPQVRGIPFVTRTATNNGIGGYVELIDSATPYPAHCLTIALGGSIGSTFLQNNPFYTSQNVAVLKAKEKLSNETLLFLATIIEKEGNKRFVAFGRELNKHIKRDFTIKLPLLEDNSPNWSKIENIAKSIIPILPSKARGIWQNQFDISPVTSIQKVLNVSEWKEFEYQKIFMICKGFYNKKPEVSSSEDYTFIGASDSNNGVTAKYSYEDIKSSSKTGEEPNADISEKIFKGNCISVSNNGSVGYAFYQSKAFTCSHDINPLYINPKWKRELNQYIAMFLCTVIMLDRYRWGYGRKWRPKRMPTSKIKLPVDKEGNPDWQFMEDYIKSLPYSANI